MPRHGNQEPTHRRAAEYELTEGKFAVQMANKYGMRPHPWQQLILDDWLAVKDGRLVHSLCLLPVPRQNGKTGVCDPRETWGLVWRGEQILHTAQEFQTAQKAFNRLRKKFGMCKNDPLADFPELNALVDRYTTSANQMVLDLKNGGHIEFRTRGNSSDMGRGGTFDLVVIDEAQSYTEEQDAALSPLNSAAPSGSPQTILMGTVPDPAKMFKGEKFASLREVMLTEPFEGGCIHEWSTTEIGDVFDKNRWYAANPSLGYQLLESGLEKDVRSMSPDTFAREHLGWWSPTAGREAYPISKRRWDAAATDNPPQDGKTAYGVKFSIDGSEVCVCAALLHGGTVHVEEVERRNMGAGTAWLAEWIAARKSTGCVCVIDGKAGAQALVDRLGKMPVRYIHVANLNDMYSAASTLVSCVNEQTLTWYAPQDDLRDSATTSIRRPIGRDGGWGFGGANPIPIEAAALAVWGVKTSKRDPRRKGLVG